MLRSFCYILCAEQFLQTLEVLFEIVKYRLSHVNSNELDSYIFSVDHVYQVLSTFVEQLWRANLRTDIRRDVTFVLRVRIMFRGQRSHKTLMINLTFVT